MQDKPKILIAEDVDGNYFLLRIILEKSATLLRAVNGKEAVEIAEKEKPDIILMDIRMPIMDGLEATAEIRKFDTETPIIALTAYAYNHIKEDAMESGLSGYLKKPIRSDVIKEELKKYNIIIA